MQSIKSESPVKGGYVLDGGKEPGANELDQINKYTRRNFTADELYTFPVVLCDNEIDRDGERFTVGALQKLSQMFVGKTGIFDHSMRAQNQTARIYSCRVENDETKRTAAGETYTRLVGQAYLPKTTANADFITELEGGIKKEVSVGCAVAKVTCSICGADLKNGGCEHVKGVEYGGKTCCAVLDEPTDAYEWSFVAVPAQREAGVIKNYTVKGGVNTEDILKAMSEIKGEITLTKEHSAKILEKIARLEKDAASGRSYREALRRDFIKYAALAQPEIEADSISRAADAMSIDDLKCWALAFRKQAQKLVPLCPQLAVERKQTGMDGNAPFKI